MKDNLCIQDSVAAPKVSFIRRFHCITLVVTKQESHRHPQSQKSHVNFY